MKVLLLGAGKIGSAIVDLLQMTGDYEVAVADSDQASLKALAKNGVEGHKVDLEDKKALAKLFTGRDAVISALPYYLNTDVAQVAADKGVHYFDLTEDVETTRAVKQIASSAKSAFMP